MLEGKGLDGDPVSGEGGDGGRVGLLGGGLALVGQEGLVLCEVDVGEEPRRKLLLDVQGLSFFLGVGGSIELNLSSSRLDAEKAGQSEWGRGAAPHAYLMHLRTIGVVCLESI